ncbi:MAG: acetate--CoA ligase family protein [Burkholderiales bacterium]
MNSPNAMRPNSGADRARFAQALFSPRAIALIGASGDAKKNTARPQRYLRKHGYASALYPVNATRPETLGERAYSNVSMIGAPVDHAFIMVPTGHVIGAIEECGACGIPIATIFSDGFAEIGAEGLARQARLVARARAVGVRLLGPNCMGLINTHERIALSINAVLEMETLLTGPLSVISQSGSMMGALLSRGQARGVGFAKLISVGNESDISVGELIDLLVDDPHTETILLFLETIRDADTFARAARRAFAAGKPVVAYKLGRSHIGAALAVSHTGALAGADDVIDAFFRRHGILRVDMLETLLEIGPLIAGRRPVALSRAPRIAAVTTTGGGAATVADRMGTLGMDAAVPDDLFIARMQAAGVPIRKSPIIDLTLTATSAQYGAVLDGLQEWDGCDAVLAVVGSSAQFHPQLAVKPIVEAARANKPLAAFLAPDAPASLRWLAEQRVPAFRTPESCADAMAAYFRWQAPTSIDDDGKHLALPISTGSERLTERTALAIFASLGIETVRSTLAQAPEFSHGIAYPVVAKVSSADIAHKSEAGGVLLNIRSDLELRDRANAMLGAIARTLPQAHLEGVLVQAMEQGLGEAIVGYRHDPMIGPIVLVGAGGILAEAIHDVAVAVAPVDLAEAHAMIARIKSFAPLRGFRNLPHGDLDALANAVVAISRLALLSGRPVSAAEINPLMIRRSGNGAVAVDGLLTVTDSRI